jgi:L-ascorbate metabolism protein UlaG (beta-lactamase superfamily)
MKLKRTANAGVLLELDGVSILLDGVCREVKPYPATPQEERTCLSMRWPDVVAYTHAHKDHYDPAYAAEYTRQTGRVILGPECAGGVRGSMQNLTRDDVTVMPISCRHIGLAGKDTPHCGFVIKGTKTVWFTGDSSPLGWKNRGDLPEPDVMIVPYAFVNSHSSWDFTKSKNASIVLLHMPKRADDTAGLWDAVENTVKDMNLIIVPEMLETVTIV